MNENEKTNFKYGIGGCYGGFSWQRMEIHTETTIWKGECVVSKTFTNEYLMWSKEAQKARIDRNMSNKFIAEDLGYSRQLVTAVINGRKESSIAIARISRLLNIAKPAAFEGSIRANT